VAGSTWKTSGSRAVRPPGRQACGARRGIRRKIRAAVEARTDPDLVIIARTDAIT
jgi:2-methylisocitrate lyase-like PEP mutase family enzyme